MITEHIHENPGSLLAAIYLHCIEVMTQGLQTHGDISILLSGGTTPLPLYRLLAQATLPWAHIHAALVDERWVEPDNRASNEKSLREAFAENEAALDNFTGMYLPGQHITRAVPACNDRYRSLPPPALCLLGMGNDAHTASLFPHAEGLGAALTAIRLFAAIEANPSGITGPFTTRMTLTPWAILQAEHLLLLITGQEKRDVYQQALVEKDFEKSPISLFLQQQQRPVEVFWCP